MGFPFFGKIRRSKKCTARGIRPALEALEDRVVPTAYIFVDFGDNFPGTNHVLTTTVGAVRDVQDVAATPNLVIQGPQLTDANNNDYTDGTDVDFTWFNSTAELRAQMIADARRAFAGVDVTVVELTATVQTLADGRSVAGAANMADVAVTLRGNGTATHDVYVIVASPAIGPNDDDPTDRATFGTNVYGGIAPTGTVLGDVTDLQSSFNDHDDLVLNFRNDANTIVHEAGHALGLYHGITTAVTLPGAAVKNVLAASEVMSYLSTNLETSIFFSRFPMVRGDDNTDPDTSTNPPTPPPLNNNDLLARRGDQRPFTPFDQLRVDPNVGENPNLHYISGTGANDIITITRGEGNTANVGVRAYMASADDPYDTAILFPGQTGSTNLTYTYTVDLDRRLLIQGGLGDDRIVIDGALNALVEVDGMAGNDELIINDQATFANFAMNYTVSPGQVTRERIDFIGVSFQSTWLTVSHTDVDAVTLNAGISLSGNVIDVGQTDAAVDGRLTVNGGAGLDLLFINDQGALEQYVRNDYTVTATEVARARRGFIYAELTVGYAGIEGLALNAAAVSSINVTSLSVTPVALNLGSVQSSVVVGQANAAVDGQLTVNGGGIFDVLTIYDQGALEQYVRNDYTVTATKVARERRGFIYAELTVDYAGIEGLALNAAAVSSINVTSLPVAPVTLNLGSATSSVAVGQADTAVDGQLTINGGGIFDVLTIYDQGALEQYVRNDYTVTATKVARERRGFVQAPLTVGYAGIEGLTLNAAAVSSINVTSLPVAPVTLNLGSATSSVAVGQADTAVDGQLTINGGGVFDVLTINDQASASAPIATYTVTAAEVARERRSQGSILNRLAVGYGGIEQLTVETGIGDDLIEVQSTAAGTTTLVDSGRGADVIQVGNSGRVSGINGALHLQSATSFSGVNLFLDDSNELSPKTDVVLDDGSVTGLAPATISWTSSATGYGGITGVYFFGGRGDDNFTVQDTSVLYHFTWLSPGAGANQVNVRGTTGVLIIQSVLGGHNDVIMGSQAPALGGTLADLHGSVYFTQNQTYTNLILDDSGATAESGKNVTFGYDGTAESISGLSPAPIYFIAGSPTTGVRSLQVYGGQGDDRFTLTRPLNVVAIDGGPGTNTLDYSTFTTSVIVNLLSGAATGLTAISRIQNATGGASNDILVGDAAVNALRGGAGRDLLIGGLGADLLDGGADDDIVIGGSTDYDTDVAALDALLAAWAQPLTYHQRIENLMDNGVAYAGGTAFLDKKHVHDDLAADLLTGGLGRDWFFRDPLRTGLDAILDLVAAGQDKETATVTRN